MSLPDRKILDTPDVAIAVRDTGGPGDALVLLHGLGGLSDIWANQFAGFRDHFRVLAWDMPGYGVSSGFSENRPEAGLYARALKEVLDRLCIRAAHVVGQSVAALIAGEFVAQYPERSLSYIFCQGLLGFGSLPEGERVRQRDRRIQTFCELGPAGFADRNLDRILGPETSQPTAQFVRTTMEQVPIRGYCQATAMLASADFFCMVPRVRGPSLVIAGAADRVSPADVARSAREALGEGPLEVIEGAGHYGCLERPGEFDSVLRRFLEGVARPGGR